jgi:hypothetical protein
MKKKADERKFVMHKNISHNQGYTIDEMKKIVQTKVRRFM